MNNNMRVMKLTGDPSSKYGLNPDQFEKDIQKNEEEAEKLWNDFVQFMREHNVDPRRLRTLFHRYHEEFIKG